jgi:myo-inositol-1(or 4)-monophosphatase
MDAAPLAHELRCAQAAAAAAGDILLEGWGTRPEVRFKSSAVDLVTEYDGRAEAAVIEHLAANFPADSIVAEEGGGRRGTSERSWYIDPLDGTTNFTHGLPLFCVSIGLCEAGRPVLGVVAAPALRWTFVGARGQAATCNDRPIAVSRIGSLERALLVTGFPYLSTPSSDNLAEFAAFMRASQGVRRLGSAALDLCFVACGWLDGFWERHIKSWDLVAGAAIVEAAGGQISDPDRGPFQPETGCILASNGLVHQAMLDRLAELRR